MDAKGLIEAATYCEEVFGHVEEMSNDAGAVMPLVRHILSTVRPDDDEPVTRESCLALNARILGPRKYGFDVAPGRVLVVDMTEPDVVESEVYVMDDEHRVTLRWSPTNHDLRRLVAALGE